MNNYKIFLFGRNDKDQAIDLFLQLGYSLATRRESYLHPLVTALYAHSDGNIYSSSDEPEIHTNIILSQLNDLVVLHRNSPEDANYSLVVASDRPDFDIFKSSEGVFYSFAENNQKWVICNSINDKTTGLKKLLPKAQPSGASTEFKTFKVEGLEGLVDGKAALTAALAGETVQISVEPWEEKNWDTFNPLEDDLSTKVFFTGMSESVQKVFFRIKPKTILINGVEVPAPFTPKNGDTFFYLSDESMEGFHQSVWDDERWSNMLFGVWPSKDQVLKVIAVLKDIFEVQP
ncbi:TPA: hypothetical protein JIU02_01090 [Acinetobacter baumannii]|nr:hypothetical protein [Acinetobacter baumannii]HAV3089649.1 hypothetical protein [Acinetobacter baumannii]HAV4623777.1 hypothetical protein [Acinetobacter baumannii]HAV4639066.1 hypothetical protein [Acinetobacter baumannii]HAV4650183.1 hypothetical protein [Acinetobacter baumannii]